MATKIAETDSAISLGDGEDIESIVEDTGVTLVEFFTEWCGTCQRMKPMLGTIAADTDTAVAMIDIESHLETAIEFGAQSTPTFVLFADGQPVKQLRGGQTEQSLRELIATYSDTAGHKRCHRSMAVPAGGGLLDDVCPTSVFASVCPTV